MSTDYKPVENTKSSKNYETKPKSYVDMLLDLGDIGTTAPVMAPAMNEYFSQILESPMELVQPVCVNKNSVELLDRINGKGLSADYRFTRTPNLYSSKMANLNITFRNNISEDITDIKLIKGVSKIFINISLCFDQSD